MTAFPPARRFLGYICPRVLLNRNSVYSRAMGPKKLAQNPLLGMSALTEETRRAVAVDANRTMLWAVPLLLTFAGFLAKHQMDTQSAPADIFKIAMVATLAPAIGASLGKLLYKKTRKELVPGVSEDQSLTQSVALHLATEANYGRIDPSLLNLEKYSIYAQQSYVSSSMSPNIPANQKIKFWIIPKDKEEASGVLLASGFQKTYGGPVRLNEAQLKELLRNPFAHTANMAVAVLQG